MRSRVSGAVTTHRLSRPPRRRPHYVRIAIFILISGLVAFRIYLPTLIKNKVNETLSKLSGYYGHIEDVTLHLWRGAYEFDGLKVVKTSGKVPVPFVAIPVIDFSIAWIPLFHGNLSGKVELVDPQVNFVAGGSEEEQQKTIDKSWQQSVKQLFPIRIARLGIKNGEIHFRNFHADPQIDIYIRKIYVVATNLTNSMRFTNTLKATVDGDALAMKDGIVHGHAILDPLGAKPTFKMDLSLRNLGLPQLNPFFNHYGAVDVKTGTLSVYMEGAANEGKFAGYVKPLLEKVDIVHIKQDASFTEALKGFGVKMVSYILKNHPKDRLASRIEITGDLEHPTPNIWSAVGSFLYNWLIKALEHGIEGDVTLKDAAQQKVPAAKH